MKSIFYILVISLIFLTSCTGVKTMSKGLENEAFLELIGDPKAYPNGVNITIDDKPTFIAEVNQAHSDRPKGTVYAISTGTHVLTVTHQNQVIFKKQIFVSAQETKQINLP